MTAEVDLDEVRWAECTRREKERKLSKSDAEKLAGNRHALTHHTQGGTNPRTDRTQWLARGAVCDAFITSLGLTAESTPFSFCDTCRIPG